VFRDCVLQKNKNNFSLLKVTCAQIPFKKKLAINETSGIT
jgi:hypothetical protein